MSAFKTVIPVDVDAVRRLLPKDSFVEAVQWNETTRNVEVIWSNRNCVTPYSTPTDWSLQMLHDQQTPKGATIREVQIAQNTDKPASVTDNVKPIDRRGRRGVKVGQA